MDLTVSVLPGTDKVDQLSNILSLCGLPCLRSQVWLTPFQSPILFHLASFTGRLALLPSCAVPFAPDLSLSSTTVLSSDP